MPKSETREISKKRIVLFRFFSIILALLLLLLIEIGLRIFSYGGSMHLFVDHKVKGYEEYYVVNPFVGLKYFNHFKATEATNDIFLKQKPEDGFRIFVLGSSTIYGFPYEPNLMATRILQKRLQDAFPDKTIEVVNTSITAINSVTLNDFARQIVKYEPDAILIYAGHNEYYGAYGVGSRERGSKVSRALHFKLINLRLYQLMQAILKGNKDRDNQGSPDGDQKGTLMKRIVDDKEIVYQGEKYQKGIKQFEENLNNIIKRADKKGIPVFLSDLVSNVKDVPPFADIGQGDQSPLFNYRAAREALSMGDTIAAKELFYKAKDLDPVRFRASEDLNRIIYEMATDTNVQLVPVKEVFSAASPDGIIGNNLLAEHVHPNIEGQFLLADIFYKTVVESGLISEDPNQLTVESFEYYRRNWGYTPLDSLMGSFKVKQLKSYWPYKSLDNEIRFRDVYQPKGILETTAFSVITNPDANAETLHDQLGDYYKENGQPIKALNEYKALAYINPYWPDYLNKAANALFNLNDLSGTEKFLRQSMKYSNSYFSYTMLGEIEFIKHDYNNALSLFESAYNILDKEQVNAESRVFLLTRLYFLYNKYSIMDRKQKIRSDLSMMGYNQAIRTQDYPFEYSDYIPYNIKDVFNKAVNVSETNIDSAQYYLEKCLQINDCPVVNLYLGDILYQKQSLKVLFHYQKAYEAYDEDPNFMIRLFYAYFVRVNKAKATQALNRLKYIDPNNDQISRLQYLVDQLPDKF